MPPSFYLFFLSLLVNAQLNETIKKDLEREKVKSKIFSGIAGVAVVVTIVTILIK